MTREPTALLLTPLLLLALSGCTGHQSAAGQPAGQAAAQAAAQAAGPAAGAAEVIAPEDARLEGLPFSPAIRAGDLIFLSGAVGVRPGTSELVSDDVGEQTRQTLANIETVLRAGGAGLGDVVKCTVFLVDMDDYTPMNDVYATVWPAEPPARSTMAGTGLALGARVEIECIAYDPVR